MSPLKNPVNDATDMASILTKFDFEVIKEINTSKKEMLSALAIFSSKLKKAEVGLFYFAGHGMQIDGTNNIDSVAWYDSNSGKTHQVGTKSANGLGLYDMSGNVYEWCQDRFGEKYYSSSPDKNPQGPSSGGYRVIRGGGWSFTPRSARSACRDRCSPGIRNLNLGFRLVLQANSVPVK